MLARRACSGSPTTPSTLTLSVPRPRKRTRPSRPRTGTPPPHRRDHFFVRIADSFSHPRTNARDSVGLVSDAFTLARAGYSPTDGLLSLISHFKSEETKVVWTSVATAILELKSVWWEQPESVRSSLTALQLSIFGPLSDRLGFAFPQGEEPDLKELRALAFSVAGAAGHQPVVDFALAAFDRFVAGGEIEPDLQRSIFQLAVVHRGETAYDQILAVYRKAANPSQKIAAIGALTRTEAPELVERTLAMIATADVKDQDVLIFLGSLSANAHARRATANWFKAEYDVLYKRFETTMTVRVLPSRRRKARARVPPRTLPSGPFLIFLLSGLL